MYNKTYQKLISFTIQEICWQRSYPFKDRYGDDFRNCDVLYFHMIWFGTIFPYDFDFLVRFKWITRTNLNLIMSVRLLRTINIIIMFRYVKSTCCWEVSSLLFVSSVWNPIFKFLTVWSLLFGHKEKHRMRYRIYISFWSDRYRWRTWSRNHSRYF